MSQQDETGLSRRRLLGGLTTMGAASAAGGGTVSLLWDGETFGNAAAPNALEGGALDLAVGCRALYFDDRDRTARVLVDSDLSRSRIGTTVGLQDVKTGDLLELGCSFHLYGNPGFVSHVGTVVGNGNGPAVESEADSDGDGGDPLDEMWAFVWHDGDDDGDGAAGVAGNYFPDEFDGAFFPDVFGTGLQADPNRRQEFYEELTRTDPAAIFQAQGPALQAAADAGPLVAFGRLRDLFSPSGTEFLLDPRDDVATAFEGTACYRPSTTHFVGMLLWAPTDLPGVDDNVIQTDTLSFASGYHAIQCRHNVAEDGGPIDGSVTEADGDAGPDP